MNITEESYQQFRKETDLTLEVRGNAIKELKRENATLRESVIKNAIAIEELQKFINLYLDRIENLEAQIDVKQQMIESLQEQLVIVQRGKRFGFEDSTTEFNDLQA